jgi:lycopene beta-cyclase
LTQKDFQYDLVFAGGGLAAYLTAAILLKKCPDLRLAIVEKSEHREQHTWSFHAKDLSASAQELLSPVISAVWQGYLVKFPDHARQIDLKYCSIRSQDFWTRIDVLTHSVTKIFGEVIDVNRTELQLADNSVLRASAILDARGVSRKNFTKSTGWQKFIGFEIETDETHDITQPVIMDATVKQTDGYRFFYVLPFSKNKLLIEDTYYSDSQHLDVEKIETEITDYIRGLGIKGYKIVTKESGVLPIPLTHSYLLDSDALPTIGMRGGFFHPTSGYSLPFSVSCAEELAAEIFYAKHVHSDLFEKSLQSVYRSRMALFKSAKFLIRLNRMLFRAGSPEKRWRVLSQFYRKDIDTITEFYSGRLSLKTKLSMITGVPPVPVISGLKHFISDRNFEQPQRKAIYG